MEQEANLMTGEMRTITPKHSRWDKVTAASDRDGVVHNAR